MTLNLRDLAMSSAAVLVLGFAPASAQDSTSSEGTTESDTATSAENGTGAEIIALPEWHPEITADAAWSVEQLLDFDVNGPAGEEIGDIENVLFGTEGEVLSIIAEVGGVWDIGDTHVNVPWDEAEVDLAAESVAIPVTQDTVEDYSLWIEEVITASEAQGDTEEVGGDNIGVADTGLRVWRAAELINDYVRLRDGDSFVNYGYVDDVLVKDGRIAAVVVRPDVTWGAPGLYPYPYYGYGYGWEPGLAYYDLPYERADVEGLDSLDEEVWDD